MPTSFLLLCALFSVVVSQNVDLGIVGTKRYTLVQTKSTWAAAQEAAVQAGQKLAVPLTKTEADFLASKLTAANTATSTVTAPDGTLKVFLGCTDAVAEGTWVCQTGPNLVTTNSQDVNAYPPWACTGNPNAAARPNCATFRPAADNTKNCLAANAQASAVGAVNQWEDVTCAAQLFYVMEVTVCPFNLLDLKGGTLTAGGNANCVANGGVPVNGVCNVASNANANCVGNAVCSATGAWNSPCTAIACAYSDLSNTQLIASATPAAQCVTGGSVPSGSSCTLTAVTGSTCAAQVTCTAGVWSTKTPCAVDSTATGQTISVTFAGDLATFNRENGRALLAKGLGVAVANLAIVDVQSASVVMRVALTGLSQAQQDTALSQLRANCVAQLANSGVDCNSIRLSSLVATQCDFNELTLPSVASVQGQGCGRNLLVESGRYCTITLTNRLWQCVNPACDAGRWTTKFPCRAVDPDNSSLTGGTIAGIVIGCVLGVVGLVIVIAVAIAVTAPPKNAAVDTP